jgi:hypothetical protein
MVNENKGDLSSLNEDEQRLIRLFRCLDNDARSEMLQRLGKRLMKEAAIDPDISFYQNPEQEARQELQDEFDERLKRLWPIHCSLLDLKDYDWDVAENGWQEAGIAVSEVILGSAENDDDYAEMLVEAYLEGARRYDVPLLCEFADADVSLQAAEDEMRQDLNREALSFIRDWRENVIRRFEQAP